MPWCEQWISYIENVDVEDDGGVFLNDLPIQ